MYLGDTVAFIPVRGGSKSIELKNIKKINGRPLIFWVLDDVVECEGIDKVVVSTDSDDIRATVNLYDSDKILVIDRSEEVSTDFASTESVMLEFAEKYDFKNIILVQATSPLLDKKDLDNGLKEFENADSVLSVVNQKRFVWKNQVDSQPINYDYLNRPRRQDFDGFLVENGAFYITSKELLLKTKCRISGKINTVVMDDVTYFEIDEPSDWLIVEKLLQNKYGEPDLSYQLKNIKCLLTDCDGVLTNGAMYYTENGDEIKKFSTHDGMGFKLLRENGFITGIITGENVQLVKRRFEKLGLDELYMGVSDKLKVLDEICEKYNLNYDEIAYVGDDINDLPIINKVGFSCSVNNAVDEVKKYADYVTTKNGGDGAIREITELLLKYT